MNMVKRYKLSQIPADFVVRNDMIESLSIRMDRGVFLGLELKYKSGKQPVGGGYINTSNIGYMIYELAKLLEKQKESCSDILASFSNTPIRVAFKDDCGGSVAKCTYIGHFMKDDFILYQDLIKCGIKEN